MVPANLGVNPSLTITAMAERAMSKMPPKRATRA
jgi:cholesterol oxidase